MASSSPSERIGGLESRRIAVGGLTMHYRISTGPAAPPPERRPVVLVHGYGVGGRYMIPLAEHLAPDFRVYIPDLPGFGDSDKPREVLDIPELADALAAWMEEVGLRRAAFVGNSLGCQILAELALRHPERIECLILQGPTADPAARTYHQQIARQLIDNRYDGWPRMNWIMLTDYARAGPRRLAVTLRYLLRDRIEDKLPRVTAPTLVVRGTRDPIVPHAWARRAADLLPNGRLIEVPGAAHIINFSAPRRLARLVRAFVGRPAPVERATPPPGPPRPAA